MPGRRPVEFRLAAERFDADRYRRDNPDIAGALARGVTALGHYVASGDRDGRAPNEGFRPDWYLERHPHVRQAIADGRLAGPFHDYLRRARQRTPRRAGPATAIVGAGLDDADAGLVATLPCLAARAPGWEFWLVAPPGRLPPLAAGPNLRFVASATELPSIDLWIGLGEDSGSPPAGTRVALAPLMRSLGLAPGDRPAAEIDRMLEHLRRQLLTDCPVIPAGRRDSGPVHADPARVRRLRVEARGVGRPASAGGVVLRAAGRIAAEIAPATDGAATVVDVPETDALWITVSDGLAVDFLPDDRAAAALDVILVGRRRSGADAWRASLRSVQALRPTAALYAVDPPPGLDLPADAVAGPSLAAALAARDRPALLVPVGVELFPQAVTQALGLLAGGSGRLAIRPAMRHPDGHLESWSPGRLDHDPGHARLWERASTTVLSASARRHGPCAAAAEAGTAFGAIDPVAWRARLAPQTALGPDWLHLDCRPDGAAVGRLRMRGTRFAGGGRIVVSGSTGGALAGPCRVQATVGRGNPLAEVELPAATGFAWPIDLPDGLDAGDIVEIAPVGDWATAHGGEDPRPILFRLESVRYRPPATGSTTPSASRRAR